MAHLFSANPKIMFPYSGVSSTSCQCLLLLELEDACRKWHSAAEFSLRVTACISTSQPGNLVELTLHHSRSVVVCGLMILSDAMMSRADYH